MEKWNEKCIYLPHRLKKPVKVEEKPKDSDKVEVKTEEKKK